VETVLQEIAENVINGETANVEKLVEGGLAANIAPERILAEGLIAAMTEVGRRFECGDFYIPEMLIAARAMQAGLSVLKPYLVEKEVRPAGRIAIGTVKGDLHDIGKNLVAMMLTGAGFEVIDLGTDVPPERFVAAVREQRPGLVGMSALLTTTMQSMRSTIESLRQAGLRDSVKIIIGGAPVTESFAQEIGADAYAPDASRAVRIAKELA
jgi:5-methyltetrahydrofolate--homocysteine methyltransferase